VPTNYDIQFLGVNFSRGIIIVVIIIIIIIIIVIMSA